MGVQISMMENHLHCKIWQCFRMGRVLRCDLTSRGLDQKGLLVYLNGFLTLH